MFFTFFKWDKRYQNRATHHIQQQLAKLPEEAKKEPDFAFLYGIVDTVEQFQILVSSILNLKPRMDQTNSKYFSMSKTAMAKESSTSVPSSSP